MATTQSNRSHKSQHKNHQTHRVERRISKGGGPALTDDGKRSLGESMIVKQGGYGPLQELEKKLDGMSHKTSL